MKLKHWVQAAAQFVQAFGEALRASALDAVSESWRDKLTQTQLAEQLRFSLRFLGVKPNFALIKEPAAITAILLGTDGETAVLVGNAMRPLMPEGTLFSAFALVDDEGLTPEVVDAAYRFGGMLAVMALTKQPSSA